MLLELKDGSAGIIGRGPRNLNGNNLNQIWCIVWRWYRALLYFLCWVKVLFFCFPLPVSSPVLWSACLPRQNSWWPSPPWAFRFWAAWRIHWSLRFSTPLISKTHWDWTYHSRSPANRGGPQNEFRRQCSHRRPMCKIWPWGIQDYPNKKAYRPIVFNLPQTLDNQAIEALCKLYLL